MAGRLTLPNDRREADYLLGDPIGTSAAPVECGTLDYARGFAGTPVCPPAPAAGTAGQLPRRIRSKNSLLFFVFCILSSMNSIASISSML